MLLDRPRERSMRSDLSTAIGSAEWIEFFEAGTTSKATPPRLRKLKLLMSEGELPMVGKDSTLIRNLLEHSLECNVSYFPLKTKKKSTPVVRDSGVDLVDMQASHWKQVIELDRRYKHWKALSLAARKNSDRGREESRRNSNYCFLTGATAAAGIFVCQFVSGLVSISLFPGHFVGTHLISGLPPFHIGIAHTSFSLCTW